MPRNTTRRKARGGGSEAERRRHENRKARELWKCRGCGKRGKPKAGFPLFPRAPWKSRQRQARFPHSHSSGDEGGWKSAKPKAVFPLPPRPEYIYVRKPNAQAARAGFALRPAAGAPRRPRVKK